MSQDHEQDAEADPRAVARAIVLRQLTMGPRSRAQLLEKLERRGCPEDVAREVLDRMKEVGLVDDTAFAAELVRSQQAGRGLARRALGHELRRKGVDDETAAAALAGVDADEERARAVELVERRVRTMRGLDRLVQTRRLAGMLARKGYDAETARAVVTEVLDGLPEHARD